MKIEKKKLKKKKKKKKKTCFICVQIGAGKSGHRQHRNRIMKVINHANVKLCNKNVNLVEKNYISS